MGRTAGSGTADRERGSLAPLEKPRVNNDSIARALIIELDARLADIERLGSSVAAAHLSAAIDALCRDFGIERLASNTD